MRWKASSSDLVLRATWWVHTSFTWVTRFAIKSFFVCDAGHFHPTEMISDKISSVLTYLDQILLHVSRGVRWDSDHVVTLTDELQAIAQEIVRGGYLGRVHVGLDFFDASINRIAAWVIGTRSMLKALLMALLEPMDLLRGWRRKEITRHVWRSWKSSRRYLSGLFGTLTA